MCNDCYVTAAMKSRIAAHAAAFRKATQSPFGAGDEIGMLNLVDAASREAIMDRADPSRVYDLSVDNFVGMPGWFGAEDQPYQIWMTHTPRGEQADDVMRVGKASNELVSYSGDLSRCRPIRAPTSTRSTTSVIAAASSTVSVSMSISVAERGVRPASTSIPPSMRAALCWTSRGCSASTCWSRATASAKGPAWLPQTSGRRAAPWRVLLIRTGRMRLWPDRATYLPSPPGINREGAEFLAKAGAIVIGADNHSLEQAPSADPENWRSSTLSAGGSRRADPRDRQPRGTGAGQGLRICFLGRVHPPARLDRSAHAPHRYATAPRQGRGAIHGLISSVSLNALTIASASNRSCRQSCGVPADLQGRRCRH